MSFSRNLRGAVMAALSLSLVAAPDARAGVFDTDPAKGGFYISGFGGINFGQDAEFEGIQDPAAGVPGVAGGPALVDVDFGSARTFGGAVGAQLPFKVFGVFHPRIEIEGSSLRQTVESGAFNSGTQSFSGQLSGTALYLNNYSDIKFSENQVLVPYIGGGIGAVFLDSDIQYFPAALSAPNFAVQGEDTALGTHMAGGISFRFNDAFDLYSEARYTRIYNADFDRRFLANDGFSATVEDTISTVSVVGGLRFRF
ncbi:MAG: P44/Msp2 family outer membrane protein [Pseudomonadota bacterium]